MPSTRIAIAAVALLTLGWGCQRTPRADVLDEAKAQGMSIRDFPAASHDYFRDMDMAAGPDGVRPLKLTVDEIKGRNTWLLWCGGNEAFWDWLATHSYGFMDLLKLVASADRETAVAKRQNRFRDAGLINEPNCRVADEPDHGLFLEVPADADVPQPREDVYGRSSGTIGLRLFKNPNFKGDAEKRWNAQRYFSDPAYFNRPDVVRPYRVGMSCAFCHAAPHPLSPPKDVNEPAWANLSSNIGSQYLRMRAIFGGLLTPDTFIYHALESQPPGTIDTSLVASDNINNPNTMNALFEVGARLDRAGLTIHRSAEFQKKFPAENKNSVETLSAVSATMPSLLAGDPFAFENPRRVPRILLDGADSMGAWGALARVYLNIGTYHQEWIRLHNPLLGFKEQMPFKIATCETNSVYWQVNKERVEYLAKFFLTSTAPMRLRDAPGGREHLRHVKDPKDNDKGYPWDAELKAGRKVFAERCIICHSSKQPPQWTKFYDTDPPYEGLLGQDQFLALLADPKYRAWAAAAVETREFWHENYLATDHRVPVTVVRTNAARALATNAIADHMWADFSSESYKKLPSVGTIQFFNPYTKKDEPFAAPGGGRGYYRPASLVSLWATAPFLHNNSVGKFTGDPSVKGRMEAFDDAIRKLLVTAGATNDGAGKPLSKEKLRDLAAARRWAMGSDLNGATPERLKEDHGLIWRTPRDTYLRIPAENLPYLLRSAAGSRLEFLNDYPAAIAVLDFLHDYPFALPLGILVLAWLLLLKSKPATIIRRGTGYLLVLLAGFAALVIYFFGGFLGELHLGPIPEGTPVNLLANLDPDPAKQDDLRRVLARAAKVLVRSRKAGQEGEEARANYLNEVAPDLLRLSKCPDLVMDRGHYFGMELSQQELESLIDLLRTF